jgi:ribose/xylose/arabinose/galactoside ABC-type transport system permease subunit
MHFSTMTPILVLLLAALVSYAITRPIGDIRRHVAAVLVSVAMGVLGGVIQGIVQEAARETALVISLTAALMGAVAGMLLAWRRRNPVEQPQRQSKVRRKDSRDPHYHRFSQARDHAG